MQTITQSINYSKPFIEYSPLSAGTAFNPAVNIATIVRNMMLNAPFKWGWNRNEYLNLNISQANGQNYTVPITDFGWLEKVTLIPTVGLSSSNRMFDIPDVYNTAALGWTNSVARPNGVSVEMVNYGTNLSLRFSSIPDQNYNAILTYQMLPISFQAFSASAAANAVGNNTTYTGVFTPAAFPVGSTALVYGFDLAANNGEFAVVSVTGTSLVLVNPNGAADTAAASIVNESWAPIPDTFVDIFNTLFLGEAFQVVDDARGAQYRQRGVAALLSKAEGLTAQQKSAFLEQYLIRDAQALRAQLMTQQGTQARAV